MAHFIAWNKLQWIIVPNSVTKTMQQFQYYYNIFYPILWGMKISELNHAQKLFHAGEVGSSNKQTYSGAFIYIIITFLQWYK